MKTIEFVMTTPTWLGDVCAEYDEEYLAFRTYDFETGELLFTEANAPKEIAERVEWEIFHRKGCE